jgi:cell filamentation protein
MEAFESDCLARNTPLRANGGIDLAFALAETHVELLLIHPFREGNGRLARLLSTSMAWQAGLRTPAFEGMIRRRRPEYFAAVQVGLDRNYEPMRRLFATIICDEAL